MTENVNHPKHYNAHPSGVECIDIIEHMGFNLGNAVKYIWRADLKHDTPIEDLEKAIWYVKREIEKRQRAIGAQQEIPEEMALAGAPGLRARMGMDPQADGWIKWNGGECPVSLDAVVEFKLRDQESVHRDPAFTLIWRHHDGEGDIVAYRVLAEAQKQDDWIEWNGGKCPVPSDQRVQARQRNGHENAPLKAGSMDWENYNAQSDIVAYRIAEEEPAK